MKKIAFAHIEQIIDFTTKEEAIAYIKENSDKGYYLVVINEDIEGIDKYINHTLKSFSRYQFADKLVDEFWTVTIKKPYKDYCCGW